MRLLADSNIVAAAVRALRERGYDVTYVGERPLDPGDLAILTEAFESRCVFLTKDHDVGTLVFKDRVPHAGIVLFDDIGSVEAEINLISETVAAWQTELSRGAFVRAGRWGSRIASPDTETLVRE